MPRVRLARFSRLLAASRSSPPVAAAPTTRTAAAAGTPRSASRPRARRAVTLTVSRQATSTTSTRAGVLPVRLRGRCTPTNRPLYSFEPDDDESRSRTSPTASREVSEDQKTVTVKIKPGHPVRPAGQPRGQGRRRQVRDRARLHRQVPYGYARSYFGDIEGAREPTRASANLGHRRRPTTRRSCSARPSRSADGPAGARACRSRRRCPRSTRRSLTPESPSTYDQYVAFTGPYMVANDPRPARSRAARPASDRDRPQPELGQGADSAPRSWTRSRSRRATTT